MENPCTTAKSRRDYVLLRQALDNNDQKAYASLMSLYRDSIYYLLMKMVKNSDDAEDLTLETFGKAFRYLDRYSPKYAFSTWLFRIAMNNGINYIHRKSVMPQTITVAGSGDSPDNAELLIDKIDAQSGDTPEDYLIEKQRMNILRCAVRQLPEKYRKVVELRYYSELSYEEIAATLNISLSNVKIQLLRAKNMLAQLMENMRSAI
jgi:RNA polymerase sigma factor (sigma-70 family)